MRGTVYTLGYTGMTPEQLLATAERLDAVVLDIRFAPRSRVPHWNKGPLSRLLGERYAHVQALGNVNYRNGGPIQLKDEADGAVVVSRFVHQGHSVVLMCACGDLHTCHRLTAANAMQKVLGCRVEHLDPKRLPPAAAKPPSQQLLF